MRIRKGNIQRVSPVASAAVSASNPGAMICVRTGARPMPASVTSPEAAIRTLMACRPRESARSRLSWSAWEKTGTNAADRAPSATSCRARLASV